MVQCISMCEVLDCDTSGAAGGRHECLVQRGMHYALQGGSPCTIGNSSHTKYQDIGTTEYQTKYTCYYRLHLLVPGYWPSLVLFLQVRRGCRLTVARGKPVGEEVGSVEEGMLEEEVEVRESLAEVGSLTIVEGAEGAGTPADRR